MDSSMPRMPRPIVPGQPLHLIQRGHNRSASFHDRHDFAFYLRVLTEESRRAGCAIHAYVLMTNHVHLLITPDSKDGPARMMQRLGRRYVRYFNKRRGRTGTLWEGRYRSTLVDSDRYLLACSRYIELNPVRAGIVADPAAYGWSSYRCNATGRPDPLITPHATYRALAPGADERRAAYRALFDAPLERATLDAIRDAAKSGAVLGTARFREQLEAVLKRSLVPIPHGGDRRPPRLTARNAITSRLHYHRFSTTLTP